MIVNAPVPTGTVPLLAVTVKLVLVAFRVFATTVPPLAANARLVAAVGAVAPGLVTQRSACPLTAFVSVPLTAPAASEVHAHVIERIPGRDSEYVIVTLPAIYEIRGRARLADLVTLAGGLTITASGQKASVERIVDRQTRRVEDFSLDKEGLDKLLQDGDLVKVNPLSPRFDNAITVRGNVAVPARHPWRTGIRVRDVLPDRDALIVPDYWTKRNASVRTDVAGKEREETRQREAASVRVAGNVLDKDDVRDRDRDRDSQRSAGQVKLRNEVRRSLPEVNWDYAVVERLNTSDLTTSLIPFNLGKAILENDPAQNVQLQPGDEIGRAHI